MATKTSSKAQAGDSASPLRTEPEAAAYLRISRTTLIRLRETTDKEGKPVIDFTRIGNKIFYTQAQLDGYITRSATNSQLEESDAATPAAAAASR